VPDRDAPIGFAIPIMQPCFARPLHKTKPEVRTTSIS
jgi:hypothetical protein